MRCRERVPRSVNRKGAQGRPNVWKRFCPRGKHIERNKKTVTSRTTGTRKKNGRRRRKEEFLKWEEDTKEVVDLTKEEFRS